MTTRCTLDGFVITPIEPPGSLYAGTDHGRLFINEARTGVMAWWSMGRWTDRAAREAIIAHAMTMTLADFRRWFARHAASCLVDEPALFVPWLCGRVPQGNSPEATPIRAPRDPQLCTRSRARKTRSSP